jgi:hypothetical protein
MSDSDWKLVDTYTVSSYRCGLRAGDRVALRRDFVVRDHLGRPTGKVYPAGEVWSVLNGSEDDPGVIWFRQADGERHTWDDGPEVFEWFEPQQQIDG